MLPFLIPRIYRPLMLQAWSLTNVDIGIAFAAYGVTSTLSYLFGGPFADKYNPRFLISLSLASTALSTIYMIFFPSPMSFVGTYAFLGVSTVLLMWGALIKTTHVIGGEEKRSTALGVLDSGRGLIAALAATSLIFLISSNFPDLKDQAHQVMAIRAAYFSVVIFILLVAVGILYSLRDLEIIKSNEPDWEIQKAIRCLKNVRVWLLSIIILSAYCGYKGIDNYSIYLVDVYKLDSSQASKLMSIIIWLRPLAALVAGIVADKLHSKMRGGRFLVLTFLLAACALSQVFLSYTDSSNLYLAFSIIATSVTFVYGLRAVYFSVFGDLNVETYLVGTTVGIASFVGFLPDIFLGYISGRLIDGNPGELGFKYTFLFTAACLFIGAIASAILYCQTLRRNSLAATKTF